MPDVIEKLSHSIVQHGSYNRRIYLMKLHERDMPSIVPVLEHLAREKGYEKVLVKTPARNKDGFAKEGYHQEAIIPYYFKDRQDAVFMAKYFSSIRRQGMASCLLKEMENEMIQQGLKTAYSIARSLSPAMNITFVKNGYKYGGTLGNNTNIAGRIESMNIWYKHL